MATMTDTATVEERYTKALEQLGHQLVLKDQKDAGELDPADVRARIEGYAGPEADRAWWADFHRKRAGAGAKGLAAVETEIARLVEVVEACCREEASLRPLQGSFNVHKPRPGPLTWPPKAGSGLAAGTEGAKVAGHQRRKRAFGGTSLPLPNLEPQTPFTAPSSARGKRWRAGTR